MKDLSFWYLRFLSVSSTAFAKNSKTCSQVSPVLVRGLNGVNGHNGLPGRDGRDGAKGEKGVAGLSGPRGIKGVADTPGSRDIKGVAGTPGSRGMKGEKGPSGTSADHRNWKQSVWKNANGRDIGLIKGNLYLGGCSHCCKRWFITFNGAECSGPLPIEAVQFIRHSSQNNHRPEFIEGYCNNWNSVPRLIIEEVPRSQ